MLEFARRNWLLLAILLIALLIRLPGVPYGLPDHLIADEEVNVYSALQMIQLKTLLPVFHPDEFKILYSPPMLAYVYVLFFVPTLAVLYVFSGMPPTSVFADMLILDPTALWVMGRLVSVTVSLGSIFLLYRFALALFSNRVIALISSLLLATSFIDATLAATTRHWALGTFFSLLSLFFVLRHAEDTRKRSLFFVLSGIALGLSFGTSYLVYYAPFIGLFLLYLHWKDVQTFDMRQYISPALLFGIPFLIVVALYIIVAPQPFFQQIIHHVYSDRHTVPEFVWFYTQTLLNYETPILLASLVGFAMLVRDKKYELLAVFGVFFATTIPIIYVFLWDLERYIQPLLPLLALAGGYGVYRSYEIFPKRILLISACIVFSLYTTTVFARYAYLAFQNDTKVQAKNWILSNIPHGSLLIVDSERVRFKTTPEAASYISEIDPGLMRAADRLVQRRGRIENDSYHAFHLNLVTLTQQKEVLEKVLAFPSERKYLLTDNWSTTIVAHEIQKKELVAALPNGSTIPVPIGLYIGGEEHTNTGAHILSLLWNTDYLGPNVFVYKLD